MPDGMDRPMGSRSEQNRVTELDSDASFDRWFDRLVPGDRLSVLSSAISRCTPQELLFVAEACASRRGVFDRLNRDPFGVGGLTQAQAPAGATGGGSGATSAGGAASGSPKVVTSPVLSSPVASAATNSGPHSPQVPQVPQAPHAPGPSPGPGPHANGPASGPASGPPLRLGGSPLRPYIGKKDHFSQAFLRPSSFNPWPLSQEIVRPKSATDWWPSKKEPHLQPIGRPKDEKHHSDSEESRTTKRFPPGSPGAAAGSAGSASGSASGAASGATLGPQPSQQHPHPPPPHTRAVNFMDPELLSDIGAWLRSLRLHKYTGNLAGMRWQDVIQLDDKQLEARGVNALGARRKMLKMFEEIRAAQDAGKLPK